MKAKKKDTALKCVRSKVLERPIILCFEGEEISMNKAAKRYLSKGVKK